MSGDIADKHPINLLLLHRDKVSLEEQKTLILCAQDIVKPYMKTEISVYKGEKNSKQQMHGQGKYIWATGELYEGGYVT